MKVVAAIITRNLPELADELYEDIKGLVSTVYVIENGSDIDKRSKNANICFEESNGISWAVNFAIQKGIDDGYDAVWVNYNDARFDNPDDYLQWSIKRFNEDKNIGVITGYWGDIWDMAGRKNPMQFLNKKSDIIVTHFSPLSFIVTSNAAKIINKIDKRCTPFWDSKNYAGHLNTLSTGFALASAGMYMLSSTKHIMTEKDVFNTENSEENEKTIRDCKRCKRYRMEDIFWTYQQR